MSDAKSVTKKIKDEEIKFVDLRFTDPRGKMQHVTMDSKLMDEDAFSEGIMFDGSSIAGWKVIAFRPRKAMTEIQVGGAGKPLRMADLRVRLDTPPRPGAPPMFQRARSTST